MRKIIKTCLITLMLFSQVVFAASTIQDLQVVAIDGNRVCVQLTFDGKVSAPKSFATENPARVVLDFQGAKNGLSREKSRSELNTGMMKRVAVVESGDRSRVVIDLKESVPFEVKMEGNQAIITMGGGIPPAQSASDPFQGQVYNTYESSHFSNGKFCIGGIDFHRGKEGEGRIVVDLNHTNIPIDLKEEGQQIRIRFAGAQLPKDLQHKLDVTDFGTPVSFINTIQKGDDVEMTIQMSGFFENLAYQADKRFTVEVKPLTKEEKDRLQAKNFKYTGERLSLNFQDIEVRAVLQLIADFTGLNLVTSDTVTGSVTLRLRNVPWDEALDIILKTKGLAKRKIGHVLMVGPSEEIAAREKLELQASQQVEDLSPLRSEYMQVNYAKAADLAALLKTDKNSMLSSRGTVSVDERTNTLLVQDTANKIEEIRSLIRRLDVPVRQVLIESRVVFANDDFEDALGVTFSSAAKFRPGNEPVVGFAGDKLGADNIAQGATPASQALVDRLNVNLPAALPSGAAGFAQFGLAIARLPGGTILDLELMALENEGLGKIVASPRLVTSNQQQAYIESGEEIPYQEAASSGATSIAFKKAVLRLEVTPQITPDDHIILDLKVNQDSRGVVTAGVPAINTREIHTKVLVANGETVVLGGIYQQQKNQTKTEVPFLGKLPVVGWLFRNETNSDHRNELLIFVTPKIIQDGMV
ncbi:type IV pilus secretin PilQ [Candidatus Berkiella aquae]|uniref:Type IV pilus biogenesis and competence protein PilQ n=1 Tax=Candidatus Berkiella aquae TaxID=295108 RepID=A0A0Q9YK08_9GAMM|nr:type IV pilus secretin PilQ [Candidatus Berkiella aquae]MCS5710033.1 type IV pilus secretin PilQ [Candidatus Berkiella aquae]